MITNKQKQRDFEYDGDYKAKSPYTIEQWTNLLSTDHFSEDQKDLLKEIYSSFNHAANLLQLGYGRHKSEDEILALVNEMGEQIGSANDKSPETDFSGREYWWYLLFWGKDLDEGFLELKLLPELSEAIGATWPELEESYYAFMNDVERSLQIRYSQEDAVWAAASILVYEKYTRFPGITTDDLLLMQYELQTRAQKIFGQDVNANTISQYCNADERGHRYNYLRDIYKYYRPSFPGEFEGDRERPDPEEFDYSAYVYTIYGYKTLAQIQDFLEHEYAHLVDESYIALEGANGFVRLAAFVTRHGGSQLSPEDNSEKAGELRVSGADGVETFHMIADALLEEYPNFTYAKKAVWFDEESSMIIPVLADFLHIESYREIGAFLAVRTVTDKDQLHIETSLNLPVIDSADVMEDIMAKCEKLSLITTAAFQVSSMDAEPGDLTQASKIKAFVLYRYEDYASMKEEDIVGMIVSSLEILASYYTDLCQNYYPAGTEEGGKEADNNESNPLLDALGSKLVYREAADVPGPNMVYKEAVPNASTEYITQALQSYGSSSPEPEAPASREDSEESYTFVKREIPDEDEEPIRRRDVIAVGEGHPDRADQTFRLYPKNTLIKGPMKTGKFHEAILNAVGIIEGKDKATLSIEPFSDILAHYKEYVDQRRILQLANPDFDGKGYQGFIEDEKGNPGIFYEFAAGCGEGRYVIMLEDIDISFEHLFGDVSVLLRENRRIGASSETAITLPRSRNVFRLPSNLYLIATCDSIVSEDTILGAISHDFYIRHVAPDPRILHNMRVEGISLERLMTTINRRISYFLGPDHQLGEGFYLANPERDALASLGRVFRDQIIPILESWFDQDYERIRFVLGDNAKTRNSNIFYLATAYNDHIFKGEMPDSFDTGRIIYELNEEAFFHPASYISIYE